jgi:hypothetical protein
MIRPLSDWRSPYAVGPKPASWDVQRERRDVLRVDRAGDQDRNEEEQEPAVGEDRGASRRQVRLLASRGAA